MYCAHRGKGKVGGEDAKRFKDRLVGSDTDKSQQTGIIDDQADYFSIEGNAWLDRDERRRFREEQEAQQAAEEERRRKIGVTLDLLGRKVEKADAANSIDFESEPATQESTAHASTDQKHDTAETPAVEDNELVCRVRKAAEAAQAVRGEGGGGGAEAALQAAREHELARTQVQPHSSQTSGSGRLKDDDDFDQLLLFLD